MAGREIYGKEEIQQVMEVLENKVLFRYGFEKERKGIYKVAELEKEFAQYIGCKYAQAVSSGSAAVKIALESLNLQKGKEVIVPSFTFVASIEAIEESGLKPVLCEIDESFNMDPADMEKRITSETVAIVPVHMMGSPAKIDIIKNIARTHNIKLVEDNCQSTGASFKGKKLGTFGDIGSFSFDFVKVMTTGEGGMVTTDDETLYKQAEWYHDHGHPHSTTMGRGQEKRTRSGFNFRMNEIQGALGLAQLHKLDFIVSKQKENKKIIKEGIKNISGIKFRDLPDEEGDIATFLVLLLPDAEKTKKFEEKLIESGITPGTMNYWHFDANVETWGGNFPESQAILKRAVYFSVGTNMEQSMLEKMIDAVKNAAGQAL